MVAGEGDGQERRDRQAAKATEAAGRNPARVVGGMVEDMAGSVAQAVEADRRQEQQLTASIHHVAQEGQRGRANGRPLVGRDLQPEVDEEAHRDAPPRRCRRRSRRSRARRRGREIVNIAEGAKPGRPQRREDGAAELGPRPRRKREAKREDLRLVEVAADAEYELGPHVRVQRQVVVGRRDVLRH